jgi:hypothetical protein
METLDGKGRRPRDRHADADGHLAIGATDGQARVSRML